MKCIAANEIADGDEDILMKVSRLEFAILKTLIGHTVGGGHAVNVRSSKMYSGMVGNGLPMHIADIVPPNIKFKDDAQEKIQAQGYVL